MNQKEYRLLRPLPTKVVGQKLRTDDLTAILNLTNFNEQSLIESGWIEHWIKELPKTSHRNTKRYRYGDARIDIMIENHDKAVVDKLHKKIETIITSDPTMYLTKLDLNK